MKFIENLAGQGMRKKYCIITRACMGGASENSTHETRTMRTYIVLFTRV